MNRLKNYRQRTIYTLNIVQFWPGKLIWYITKYFTCIVNTYISYSFVTWVSLLWYDITFLYIILELVTELCLSHCITTRRLKRSNITLYNWPFFRAETVPLKPQLISAHINRLVQCVGKSIFWFINQSLKQMLGSGQTNNEMLSIWSSPWAFYQIRKNCGLRMRRECRERLPRHRVLAISTCITARAWHMCLNAQQDR